VLYIICIKDLLLYRSYGFQTSTYIRKESDQKKANEKQAKGSKELLIWRSLTCNANKWS